MHMGASPPRRRTGCRLCGASPPGRYARLCPPSATPPSAQRPAGRSGGPSVRSHVLAASAPPLARGAPPQTAPAANALGALAARAPATTAPSPGGIGPRDRCRPGVAPRCWGVAPARRIPRAGPGRGRWGGWLRPAAFSSERHRPRAGTGEADALSHTVGHTGPAPPGGTKSLGRRARGRRQPREPGRGQADHARPALIAGGRRQGPGGSQAPREGTGKTGPQAAGNAVRPGRRLSPAAARRARAVQGYRHECVQQTQQADARGEVHEARAAGLCSRLQPSRRVCRGRSQATLPGAVGCLPSLRHARQQNACAQAERRWRAALDPAIAPRARRGAGGQGLDHCGLLQIAIN